MPRLNQVFANTVFSLYGKDPSSGETRGPLGTGFLVGLPGVLGFGYYRHIYAVTCQHVAPDGASIIRINTRDGASRLLEFEPHEWEFIPGGDDIAAVDVTDRLTAGTDTFSFVPESLFLNQEVMGSVAFGIGEDGFMLGVFPEQPGKNRNLVAARFGNVSLLAQEGEPLKQPNGNRHPSHLFDMRSRPGFSGSPIFVYRTPAGDLRMATERGRVSATGDAPMGISVFGRTYEEEIRDNTFLYLFGIHAGQYHDRVVVERAKGFRGENVAHIVEGDELDVPNSVALVVPSWKVRSLLDQEALVRQRRERDRIDRETKVRENDARPESTKAKGAVRSEPSTTADNPSHKEDFTRLVGAAARKKKRDD